MMRLKRFIIAVLAFSLASPFIFTSIDASAQVSNNLQLAYVDQSGNVYLKTGGISAPFTKIWDSTNPAQAVEVSRNGIVILDQNGTLYANQLPIASTWVPVTDNVNTRDFGITDNTIVLFTNATLYSKPLAHLTSGWSPFMDNVQGFNLSANGNIVAETLDNTLYEAYGGYGAQWKAIATGFGSYAVSNNTVAAVFGTNLYVMIGAPVNNSWRLAYTNANIVQLSPNGNIGVTDPQGYLDVAMGGYGSQWSNHVSNSNYTYVSDQYITTVNSGVLTYPQGGPGSNVWGVIASSVDFYSME